MSCAASGEFEFALQQTRELIGIFREAANRHNISENEFWIWYSLIILEEDLTQQEICSAWSLHKQTVNTIVAGMVKKGYATLKARPGTRNSKRICLTDPGRLYGQQLIQPVFEAEKRAFARMPQEHRQLMLTCLSTYVGLLQQEMGEV